MPPVKIREVPAGPGRKKSLADEGKNIRQGIKGIDGRRVGAAIDEAPPVLYASEEVAERVIERYDELVFSLKQSMQTAIQMLDNAINVQTITDRQNNARRTKHERNLYYMDELIVTARDLLKKKLGEIDY